MFCKSYNDFFQTLANPTNQSLIQQLLKKSMSVSELTRHTKLEQSQISHSLKRLHECRVVEVERSGKQRIYSLNKDTIVPILKIVDSHAKQMCPQCIKSEIRNEQWR